jgi:CBS domain-containing protein
MQVSEVMSKGIISVSSLDSVRKVAKLMKEKDIGAVPVIDKDKAVGLVTDRDIVINCVAGGYNLDGPISHAMSETVVSVTEDQDVEEASRLMQQHKISRVLVTDKDRHPIGMVGIQDLTEADEDMSEETISRIKQ